MTSNVMRPSSLNDWKFLPLVSRWPNAKAKAKAGDAPKEEVKLEIRNRPEKTPRGNPNLTPISGSLGIPSPRKAHVDH